MRISVVIPAFNDWMLTRRCVDALRRTTPAALVTEIIVVDDASTDGVSARWACQFELFRRESLKWSYVLSTRTHRVPCGRSGTLPPDALIFPYDTESCKSQEGRSVVPLLPGLQAGVSAAAS